MELWFVCLRSAFHYLYRLSSLGSRGAGADIGRRQGTPWTGRQSIQGTYRDRQPFTLTFIHTYGQFRDQLTCCMSSDCGRKPENTEGTHAATGRTCKLHTEGPPRPGIEPTALLLWDDSASHYTTVQPCAQHLFLKYKQLTSRLKPKFKLVNIYKWT